MSALIQPAGLPITADSGWTAAAATPSKTVSLPTYTSGTITGTMITALNVTSAGLGTAIGTMDSQMAALTARLSQLEATLASQKLPNA